MLSHNKETFRSWGPSGRGDGALWLPGRTDLRCTHRLGHAEEDHHTLPAAAGRECFGRYPEAALNVLPVVHHPDVARWSDREIGLHLQTSADIADGRRDLVAGLHVGRTILGAGTTKLYDWTVRSSKIGYPDIVVAVRCSLRTGETAAREWRAGVLAAIRPQSVAGEGCRREVLPVSRSMAGHNNWNTPKVLP